MFCTDTHYQVHTKWYSCLLDAQQATILPIEDKPEPDTSLTPATSSLMENESESGTSIGKNDFHHRCMGQVFWWWHTRLYLLYIYIYIYISERNKYLLSKKCTDIFDLSPKTKLLFNCEIYITIVHRKIGVSYICIFNVSFNCVL